MKIQVISSGSDENCTFISSGDTSIIIDLGICCKRFLKHLDAIGESPENLSGILITHGHSDHIDGLDVFQKKYNIDLYATEYTSIVTDNYLKNKKKERYFQLDWLYITEGSSFKIGNLLITPIKAPHDSNGAVSYIISDEKNKVAYVTDVGFITDELFENLKNCDAIILEMNHDVTMLKNCDYPDTTKIRILSDSGHLSNDQAAELLERLDTTNLKYLFPAHISENSNKYDVVLAAINDINKKISFKVIKTYHKEASEMVIL